MFGRFEDVDFDISRGDAKGLVDALDSPNSFNRHSTNANLTFQRTGNDAFDETALEENVNDEHGYKDHNGCGSQHRNIG